MGSLPVNCMYRLLQVYTDQSNMIEQRKFPTQYVGMKILGKTERTRIEASGACRPLDPQRALAEVFDEIT